MNQRGKRLAILAVAVVAIVVAFVIASGGSDNKTSTSASSSATTPGAQGQTTAQDTSAPAKPAATVIVVKGGKPVGGVKKINVTKGDQVRFTVKSDVGDEIHVHGYDFKKTVKPGGSVTFSFPAKIDGVFDVELESRAEQIASLEVQP